MNWGILQRKCHILLAENFDSRAAGYIWLKENYGISHFSELNHKTDMEKLHSIYEKLYIKSILG